MPDQSSALPPPPTAPPAPPPGPQVEVVVPVYNEEAVLARSIGRLHRLLSGDFPFSWRIVIADNASTDATPRIAAAPGPPAARGPVLRLEEKGRGRALRTAWSASDAEVVCYMDVDLSTDLRALLPLVAPLLSGHSDVSIGTRLARGSRWSAGPSASSSRAPTTTCCARRCAPASATPSAASRPSRAALPSCCPRSATRAGSSTPSCW